MITIEDLKKLEDLKIFWYGDKYYIPVPIAEALVKTLKYYLGSDKEC